MATQLEIIAEKERQAHLTRNSYIEKNGYGVTHENALSNGDEKGKGEAGTIGSSVDIQARVENLLRNPYSSSNQYIQKILTHYLMVMKKVKVKMELLVLL